MNAEQTLKKLGMNRTRLMNYVKRGEIKAVKTNNRYDYNDEDVLRVAKQLRDVVCYYKGDFKDAPSGITNYILKESGNDSSKSAIFYIDKNYENQKFIDLMYLTLFNKSIRKIIVVNEKHVPMDFTVFKKLVDVVDCEVEVYNL